MNKLSTAFLVSVIFGTGVLLNTVNNTIKDVDKIDNELIKTADKLIKNDRVDLEQTIRLENVIKAQGMQNELLERLLDRSDVIPTVID